MTDRPKLQVSIRPVICLPTSYVPVMVTFISRGSALSADLLLLSNTLYYTLGPESNTEKGSFSSLIVLFL
jgi:hypothetical protein